MTNIKIDGTKYDKIRIIFFPFTDKNKTFEPKNYSDYYGTSLEKQFGLAFTVDKRVIFRILIEDEKDRELKKELLKKYLFADTQENESQENKSEEIMIEDIQWIGQTNSIFNSETCWGPPNRCCGAACRHILGKFGLSPVNKICIALKSSSNDYSSVIPSDDFEKGLTVLETSIKPKKDGGEPIMIGLHYPKDAFPGYQNLPCSATFHYMVIVGKGYDASQKQNYFRFYDVGRSLEKDGVVHLINYI